MTDRWIESRTGVRERRLAADGERLSDLAARAGLDALERSGVGAESLDLVIVATCTAGHSDARRGPARGRSGRRQRAPGVRRGRRLHRLPRRARRGIRAGRVGPGGPRARDRRRHDEPAGEPRRQAHRRAVRRRRGRGGGGPAAAARIGPTRVARRRDRRAVHPLEPRGRTRSSWTATRRSRQPSRACRRSRSTRSRPRTSPPPTSTCSSTTRPTRASSPRWASGWRCAPERVVNAIGTLGNTSAASIPLALAAAERDGTLKPDSRVLLAAFGAGFTWGATTLTWGGGDA